ncbi:glutaminyl-peptide cyclotransferase isoform X1 [Lepisosteus oculatus]|uniref:Glutaminyl-peptide cyclotransferase n=1 Tax=Lepisosteus oculatus TaxID=7918 RepID=W5NCA8_LEPOC|nr:PREDICTED: glutaminyl-peptide cyclotransferase-like protein [Lepisosteus oculatus]
MSRGGRRYRAAPVSGGSLSRWEPGRLPRARALLCGLCGLLAVAGLLGVYLSSDTPGDLRVGSADWTTDRLAHKPRKLTAGQLRSLTARVDRRRQWDALLRPILTERRPGTAGSQAVRQHISSVLGSLSAGWTVEVDSFTAPTPLGQLTFSNVLAVLDPAAPRRLLLACHYDSKLLPADSRGRVFVGASDSAVPCAMLLELASALDAQLRALRQQRPALTLQLVFFDGEEAFQEWTPTDSLYGSRHLAERMAATAHPPGSAGTSQLDAIDLFVLLDLIGAPDPLFVNHFDNTARWFDRLIAAEKRLHKLGLLASHPLEQSYFRKDVYLGPVEDDHVPFLRRGVPVLHMVATPFPSFWHTLEDSEEQMHPPTVDNLTKILAVFLAEYLGL